MNNDEELLTTAEDYKDFFKRKFINSLKKLLSFLLTNINEKSSLYLTLQKINNILNNKNIDYDKLIGKLCNNDKLMVNLSILKDSNINNTVFEELLKKSTLKDWVLIPELCVDKIIKELNNKDTIKFVIEDIKSIYVSAESYNSIVKMISENDENNTKLYNPTEQIMASKNVSNIDINTLFKDAKYKQMTSYEMIIRMMVDEKTEQKVGEYMNNIKEDDVNEAASKLDDVLKNNNTNSNATQLLGTMLSNIKDEVIGMGNANVQIDGKEAMENLMNIAKKVADNLAIDVKKSGLTPLEIWEATSSLARSTVKSDALDIVDGIIKQNIYNGMNNNPNTEQDLQEKLRMLNFDDDVD